MMDMALPSAHAAPPDRLIEPAELARLLRRNGWIIATLAVLLAAGAYLYASTLPKSYTSSATVAIEGDHFALPELQGAVRDANAPDPFPLVRTELATLTSRAMVQQVVDQLDLARLPEFNPALRPPSLVDRLKSALHALLPKSPGAPSVNPGEPVFLAASEALAAFQDNRSLTIDLSFTARDPRLAARFLNTLVADYLAARRNWRDAANQSANTQMAERIAIVRQDLQTIETKMRDLRERSGLVGLPAGSVGQQQLQELATAADDASLQRAQIEANWQRANTLSAQGDSADLTSVLGSETVSRLRDQESEAARKVADLAADHGDAYPGLRAARSDLATIRGAVAGETSRIVQSLGTQLEIARAHEAAVNQQLANARAGAVAAQNTQAELTQLQADATSQRQIYEGLLGQAQQVVQPGQDAAMPDVRLLSAAVPSGMPSHPNTKLAAALGLAAGAIVGLLIAVLRGRPRGFASAAALHDASGLPVGAVLHGIGSLRQASGGLLARVLAAPTGAEAQALRQLRGQLRALPRARGLRSVTFTAATGDARGIATAFAGIAAADGERVLLAEGNLAAPSVGTLLGCGGDGMERVLRGDGDWKDEIRQGGPPSLDVLPAAGTQTADPAWLGGVELQNLLMEAREDYSLTVFAAAPAEDGSALLLAQRTDMTVLVVDGKSGQQAQVRGQADRLAGAARKPLMALLVLA